MHVSFTSHSLPVVLLAAFILVTAASCDTAPGEIQEDIHGAAERPAYIHNFAQSALYALDLQEPAYLGFLKLVRLGSAPAYTFSQGRNKLYIFLGRETRVDKAGTSIAEFDVSRNQVIEEILLPVGYLWHARSLDTPRSGPLYVIGSTHPSSGDSESFLFTVDPATGEVSRKISLQSKYGRNRANFARVSPDGQWAAVISLRVTRRNDTTTVHYDEPMSLMLVNLRKGKLAKEVLLGGLLRSPTFTTNSESFFATSLVTGNIYHVDVSTLKVDSIDIFPQADGGLHFVQLLPVPEGNRMLLYYGMAADSTTFVVFDSGDSVVFSRSDDLFRKSSPT